MFFMHCSKNANRIVTNSIPLYQERYDMEWIMMIGVWDIFIPWSDVV